MTFEQWIELVDRHISATVGLGRDDLPDMAYRTEYEAGTSPRDMARMALREAGWPIVR